MDRKMLKKSLMRSISVMSNIDNDHFGIHEEKENRIRAMMHTYLII